MSIVKHLINYDNGTLMLARNDNTHNLIQIDGSQDKREIIKWANNAYREFQFHQRANYAKIARQLLDGCLPSVCLQPLEEATPSVNISTRYLINTFLEHMELIFSDSYDRNMFQRDDPRQVSVPISDESIEALYRFMIEKLHNPGEDSSSDNDNQNLHFLLKLTLQYLMGVKEESEKRAGKVNKQMRKIKKGSNLIGGVEVGQVLNQLEDPLGGDLLVKDDITQNLKESTQKIKEFIWENRADIAVTVAKHEYVSKVLGIMNAHHHTPLYVQDQISFTDMFEVMALEVVVELAPPMLDDITV